MLFIHSLYFFVNLQIDYYLRPASITPNTTPVATSPPWPYHSTTTSVALRIVFFFPLLITFLDVIESLKPNTPLAYKRVSWDSRHVTTSLLLAKTMGYARGPTAPWRPLLLPRATKNKKKKARETISLGRQISELVVLFSFPLNIAFIILVTPNHPFSQWT